MDVTILWFKRDLRVVDHPALARAAEGAGTVLPLYIVEPDYWALPDTSARQWRFTAESLQALSADLAALGAPLQVEIGTAVAVLDRLADRWPVTHLISHEETGNGWTYDRDLAVAAWARGRGIVWQELPQSGVVRRLKGRDGWAGRRDRFMRADPVPVPPALRGLEGIAPGAIPEARDLGLAFDPCPGRQRGGRAAALDCLDSFLTARGQDYRRAMSSPLAGASACSRLSPHIALGTVSLREVEQATAARRAEVGGARDGWAGSLKSFTSRLAWRDHFMQKLEDEPSLEHRCLHSAYEGLRPRAPDADRLAAWQKGETGLPFVDACMRSLIHTGWLNFRMRSMLMAVASYHLWLDWRATGPHLARMFTDYEPGIHWPQVQMQSGTTGMNTIRIYNPVKQGHDQDPTGAFTRRWLPELAEVPDAFLQEPWRWEGAPRLLGRRYPAPVVDVTAAARAARQAVWAVRGQAGFGAEAAQVVARHASRKDRAGRFVNDRAPRPRPRRGDARQLQLDL
ncbi:deoxyribodipyrimidine photo-lyase family protein (cryptochrome) [Rhodovulum bhavnagarense]|uniref:Deoxyribodipyrimidine photo-lyase family protein (Cryptochrome) n=1 Tax=Rhodovulum bhavnagarense TaxID=992286 RepID=A0A4R2RJR3_9RHOB|nr:deoxyribodipyrimidine photo-lyase [Rhodovulum bhavnagarense]TCP62417.1 deoxyribodipyrimidine photo-lyase family protein (cryptochrome) [Rhodovulum bhavnagarense]